MLRIDRVEHHRVNDTAPGETYTTNDQVVSSHAPNCDAHAHAPFCQVFTAYISRYNPQTSAWEPYSGIQDMQLEFTMLDPHIRTALPPVSGQPGKYSVTFRAPDRHGVFKFVIDYKRKGCALLHPRRVVHRTDKLSCYSV